MNTPSVTSAPHSLDVDEDTQTLWNACAHTHFTLVLLTQWYDNLPADFCGVLANTHTHSHTHIELCNGVEFYGSTQIFCLHSILICATAKAPPRSSSSSSSHSSIQSSPCFSSPFFATSGSFPVRPITKLFGQFLQLYFHIQLLCFASSTSICPSVSALLFKYFTFIISYFFSWCTPSSFWPKCPCCKYFIWLKSTLLFTLFLYQTVLSHAHTNILYFSYLFFSPHSKYFLFLLCLTLMFLFFFKGFSASLLNPDKMSWCHLSYFLPPLE